MTDGPTYEQERKYLVRGRPWQQPPWRDALTSRRLRQGYLNLDPDRTVRVRVRVRVRVGDGDGDDDAWLTVKGRADGDRRVEYEYRVPVQDAHHLLALADGHVVEKVRHVITVSPFTWEVDEFVGENAGLVVAECEHPGGDVPWPPPTPDFVVRDVATLDPSLRGRFANAALAREPFPLWRDQLARALG